jgi:hypothetical protein
MLLTYFLNDFEIVPVAPIITGITLVFTFHIRCISIARLLLLLLLLLLLRPSCECGNEPSGSITCGGFLDYLQTG